MELIIKKFDELSADELYEILRARSAVFVVEQNCVYQDLDGKDKAAYHLWYQDEGGIAAYIRVLPKGVSCPDCSIGRVISLRRRKGLASSLMAEGIRIAQEKFGAESIRIEAQSYAQKFYEYCGFRRISEGEFDVDGIPHVLMLWEK